MISVCGQWEVGRLGAGRPWLALGMLACLVAAGAGLFLSQRLPD
jgi:hypothetical protein